MGDIGMGRVAFGAVMLLVLATLNVIYGIAAIGDSSFFVSDQKYILSDLNTWGWVAVILGAVQGLAGLSLLGGGGTGRLVGVFFAFLGAVAAMLSIPAYPLWSLAVFAVAIIVIYTLVVHGTQSATT